MHQPEKVGSFPLIRHRYRSCDLGQSPWCQLSYVFKHCDLLVLKIIILCKVHYTSQSKSKYYIKNKILSLHSWLVKGWQV